MTPVALTVAGSDPSGGAGIQADLKTFHRFGVYGEAAISLITVQNTTGVERVEVLAPDLVAAQVESVIADIPPQAAKLGALGNVAVVQEIAWLASSFAFPLVIDPVMTGKHGGSLLSEEAVKALITGLFPCALLVTPNLPEASTLTGRPVDTLEGMREAARAISGYGARAVLIKGGHSAGSTCTDLLFLNGEFTEFPAERIDTRHTHGTGCTYSAAITALLAKGWELRAAVGEAKRFITEAIRTNPGLGRGAGPLNYWI